MENSRKVAVDVLINVFDRKSYSNITLDKMLNSSKLNAQDRALTTEIVYGTIKYKYTIDKIIDSFLVEGLSSLDSSILNILRISIYQIKYLDKVPNFAVVDEAVELAKKYKSKGASKLVNAVLRNYIRKPDKHSFNRFSSIDAMCSEFSFPKWLVKLFTKQYGEALTKKILKGLNERPCVTVRVNSLKASYDEVFEALQRNGYVVKEGIICPDAIMIIRGQSILKNTLFDEGYFTVQDESAMLVADSMDLCENLNVLDLCSAPGGKTTHIAEIMNNKGSIEAFDIYENKLELIQSNLIRLGINNVKCSIMDAEKYNESLKNSADRVLIDVPCSGLGIIRKKPEIKWNKSNNQLNALVKIQRNILMNASRYVKVGGSILYSTCTLNKDENENNILWFINNNTNFEIEPLYFGKGDNLLYSKEGYVTILPNEYMDGFFICKIKRLK
ncbi:ribosomal RNA small subunit methyltransferase B [Clostridium tepidiprofundi DSM 19306]|uniref:16S rRNA (cytosine(967)-C(5))-methyltransferase n=1 Tax=Clostridium tepidiprofundi DSM 19306 TaxID=1121338 RepID=A0A151B7L9_9CLOT|nr:16S rRNA (cytosine(967)-C(5))-methyltransferase RsmB [Clostridium tepidiprofundi]KYH35915.1 ribosomal RNA small subunit methyltransferase B [Clostridium tepidiprofundi DSM 19306]